MSERYQRTFAIPEEFPALLKDFTREILRTQPDNLYEYGARYFSELVDARAAAEAEAAEAEAAGEEGDGERDVLMMDDNELQEYVQELFMEADTDNSGTLDHKELKGVLSTARLNMSKADIRGVMAEFDANGDGVLEYREFLPVMVQLIGGLNARKRERAATEEAEAEREEVAAEVTDILLHGMRQEDLDALMTSVFQAADVDNNGYLDMGEFQACLKSAELGLTRKEINTLMAEADLNDDGKVAFEEFVPLCFDLLVEVFTKEATESSIRESASALEQYLMEGFAAVDSSGTGAISIGKARSALTRMSRAELGLTKLQIGVVLSEAAINGKGEIAYVEFVPTAARILYSLLDNAEQERRIEAMEKMARTGGAQLLRGFSRETVLSILSAAFKEADADGNGYLDYDELLRVFEALGTSELGLSANETVMLLATVDADADGRIDYGELVEFMFSALCHLERESFIAAGGVPDIEEQ